MNDSINKERKDKITKIVEIINGVKNCKKIKCKKM